VIAGGITAEGLTAKHPVDGRFSHSVSAAEAQRSC
jgi:hypothetical protein